MITRKCLKCGEFTDNSESCEFCNTPFTTEKSVKKKIEQEHQKRLQEPYIELKIETFLKKLKNHNWLAVRIVGYVLNGIFLIIFFIVSAISYIIGAIAA